MEPKRKIVLGLGNILNRDEGFGVHAVKMLQKEIDSLNPEKKSNTCHELELLDGGVLGLNLLMLVEEASHLLILDAINAKSDPGTIIEMQRDEIQMYSGVKLSDHQVTFQEVLGLARFRNKLPEHLHLIGTQPATIEIGTELSPTILKVMPEIMERSKLMLKKWGFLI